MKTGMLLGRKGYLSQLNELYYHEQLPSLSFFKRGNQIQKQETTCLWHQD